MGILECSECRASFDAARTPTCPRCLAEHWLACETLVRPKHDPRQLPLRWESYRSVLSPSLVADPRPHLEDAALRGSWFFDTHYEMIVHFTHEPLGRSPGSGIPEGQSMPAHALDSLLIAEADSMLEAHAFATSKKQFDAQILAGEFVPLPECGEPGCLHICRPGSNRCIVHSSPTREPADSGEASP
jgi:hypothetical protein